MVNDSLEWLGKWGEKRCSLGWVLHLGDNIYREGGKVQEEVLRVRNQ